MSAAALQALLAILETIIQTTPAAVGLFGQVKAVLTAGRDPTSEEWAGITTQMLVVHQAIQAGPGPA